MVPAWTSASGQCVNPRSWGHGVPERALLHVGGEGRPDVQNHAQNPQDIRGDKKAGQNSHRIKESSEISKRK